MFKISIPTTLIPNNEGKYFMMLRNLMQITKDISCTIVEDKSDTSKTTLTINEGKASDAISIFITNCIAFTIEERYEITADNIEAEIWHILNNKSISMAFKAPQIANDIKGMFLIFSITLETEHEEDEVSILDFYTITHMK